MIGQVRRTSTDFVRQVVGLVSRPLARLRRSVARPPGQPSEAIRPSRRRIRPDSVLANARTHARTRSAQRTDERNDL